MTTQFPLVGLGGPAESILPEFSGVGLGKTTIGPQPTMSDKAKTAVVKTASNVFDSLFSGMSSSVFGGLGITQSLTGIIGLILIVAGLFLLRPVRETIVNVGKKAAEGAALAA